MHKSKENPNGTFSIGKTWNLDDLTALESFTGPNVPTNLKEWAGDTGVTITLGKPYYWQAQTEKEKKFFIASLVKIYGKYTNGRMPELANFDPRELEQVLGGAQAPRRPEPPAARRPPPPALNSTSSLSSLSTPGSNGTLTPKTNPSFDRPLRSPMYMNGTSSPARSIDSSRGGSQDQTPLRRLAASNKSQDSVAASLATKSEDGSLRPRSRNGANGGQPYGGTPEPMPPPATAVEGTPPERKRPPMDPSRPQVADKDLVPAPLMSPGMRREPTVPPRSVERMSPRKNSTNRRPEPLADQLVQNDAKKADVPAAPAAPASSSTPPVVAPPAEVPVSTNVIASPPPVPESPLETPIEPIEESRPGLGPMIKSKKSRGEIAGAFWKAATAATAFKPRPGGAADRLRNLNKSADGPDGITEVVPAPPRPATPEPAPKAAETAPVVPEVKVTITSSSRPTSLQASVKEAGRVAEAQTVEPKEETPKSIVVGNDIKYLASLGLDPAILDARSNEFAKWLDYFAWVPGEQMRKNNYDDMSLEMERELNKAQAGGWLARFQAGDERVEMIKKGVDMAVAECEELDNLLTLYSVELSVSPAPHAPQTTWLVCRVFLWLTVLTPSCRRSPTTLPTSRRRDRASRCRRQTRSFS